MALSPQTIRENYKKAKKCHLSGEIVAKKLTHKGKCFTDYDIFVQNNEGTIFALSGSEVTNGCITDTVYRNFIDIHGGDTFSEDIDLQAHRPLLKPWANPISVLPCTTQQLQTVTHDDIAPYIETSYTRLFVLLGTVVAMGIGVWYYFFKKKKGSSPKTVKEEIAKETPELADTITELTQLMKERTSRQYRFLSGLVTGVGTVIGATVLSWVVIYLMSVVVSKIDFSSMPAIQKIIDQANLPAPDADEKN